MKRLKTIIMLTVVIHSIAFARVETNSGRYVESNDDLTVKVLGGSIKWTRQYIERKWFFNKEMGKLIFEFDNNSNSVSRVIRGGKIYEKLDSAGTIFKFGLRDRVRKLEDGSWIWSDRDGGVSTYNSEGSLVSISAIKGPNISMMYNTGNKLSGIRDANNNQVLWINYDPVSGLVSQVKDYTNREVNYTWIVVPNTSNPIRYKLIKVTDARGFEWHYEYSNNPARDGFVDIVKTIDPESRETEIVYGGSSRVRSVKDPLNNITYYDFDYIKSRKEFYQKISYPGGRVVESWYEDDGEMKKRIVNGITMLEHIDDLRKDITKDNSGRTSIMEFDEFYNLTKTIYPDGSSSSITYNVVNSNILSIKDESGAVTKYEYNNNNKLIKKTLAQGSSEQVVKTYTYDLLGQLKTITTLGDDVSSETVVQYFYDSYGNKNKIIDPEGNIELLNTYDAMGNNLTKIDKNGNSWIFEFDNHGNQTSVSTPLLHKTSFEYDKVGNLIKVVNPDASFVLYEYDGLNRRVKTINEFGFEQLSKYDSAGNKISFTDNNGNTTVYRYDLINRKVEEEDAQGNIIKYFYKNSSQQYTISADIYLPVKIAYPTYTKEFKYDLKDNIIEEKILYSNVLDQQQIQIKKYKYDAIGNKTEYEDPQGLKEYYSYDSFGRIINFKDADLNEINYKFDNRGNLILVTDSNNNPYSFTYNKNNSISSIILPMGQTSTYSYYPSGHIKYKIDQKNQKKKYYYDLDNRNTKIEYFNASQNIDKTVVFAYDSRNNMVSYDDGVTQGIYSYNSERQKLTESIQYGLESFNLAYTYNKNGQKSSYTGIDNVTYEFYYNSINKIENIVIPNEGNISFQNFQWKKPQLISYPGGNTRELKYDGLLRYGSIEVKDPSSVTLMHHSYNYRNDGMLMSNTTEHGNYSYNYDNLKQLISVDYPSLADESFTYDKNKNRKTDSDTGNSIWEYNTNNELLNSIENQFDYDLNGNQIVKKDSLGQILYHYKYNTENRLTEVRDSDNNVISNYYYDPFGRRLSKTITNNDGSLTTTYFHYNEEGYSAEKTDNRIISYLFINSSSWSTGPVLKKVDNTYYYYQNDYLNTPTIIHDKQGQIVNSKQMKAFGEWTNIINIIPDYFAFPGQYKDLESGKYYNFNRSYDPSVGRYTQIDPIRSLESQNLYLYTLNNPVHMSDPNGQFSILANATEDCFDCKIKCGIEFFIGDDPLGDDLLDHIKDLLEHKVKERAKSEVVKKISYLKRLMKKLNLILEIQDGIKFALCIGSCY